ncbi:MAG: hypothetical protein ACJAT2_002280 [Bacteriovoracaceae bacterium]|jgi:hypothetical protein
MDDTNRRIFLKQLFSALGYSLLPTNLLANPVNTDVNYVQINIAGGPSRWAFDNPIAPLASSSYVPHPMIVNHFSNSGSIASIAGLEYKRFKINDWYMPQFWKDKVLTSKGEASASTLLDNCLIVRGCHMRNDGHSLNNRKLSAPIPGGTSITGLLADKMSDKLFPSINLVGDSGVEAVSGGAFKSDQNSVQINTPQNHQSPLSYLLSPFLVSPAHKTRWMHLIKDELGEVGLRNYKRMLLNFNKRVMAYQKIIDFSLDASYYTGIGERPVQGVDPKAIREGRIDPSLAKYLNHDYLIGNGDFRTILVKAKVKNLAEQFATAELLLKNDLCGNITINVNTVSNLFYENSFATERFYREIQSIGSTQFSYKGGNDYYSGSKSENNFQLDSHDTGLLPNLFLTHALFKSISSCLIEFKSVLEKQKLYDKTFIHLASEFDRDPRIDCSGSEHGWNGHVSSFYSGSIKGLKVIGNIYTQSPGDSYYTKNGTWGQGAPVKEHEDRPISYGNIASSISNVLNIESPSPNDRPLFERKAGKINSFINEVKNIDS